MLLAGSTSAQTRSTAPASPYGGTTVEEIVARVNDQIISRSDYDRAMKQMDDEARKEGASMQEISAGHRDLLRNLIDQQLWLSKGKELGITGDTELIKKLNDIRKQYNLSSMEDLEKAAKEQGVSFEDFKATIRNSIITQDVMRQEVGRKIQFTPGEVERYFEAHKQDYAQPESVHLNEILISTGDADDPAKLDAAKAKAADIEAKLHSGGDFAQLARTFSDGPTASQGGDLGQFQRGSLAKVLEDKTFALKASEFTEPIRTRQGYVILKVVQHNTGGVQPFKQVEPQVEDAFFMSRMEPAIRQYLSKMRDESYIDIKPGYADAGATPAELNSRIAYSAYVPPSPKKKRKVERTRYRETAHTFRQKSRQAEAEAAPVEAVASAPSKKDRKKKQAEPVNLATMKPGKKEKIRFGKAPAQTLPPAPSGTVEDAGAGPAASNPSPEPVNPLEEAAPVQKSRFSDRAKTAKKSKTKSQQAPGPDNLSPPPPDAAEVVDRETQSAPMGLGGDTATKKKKKITTTGNKTRLSDKNRKEATPDQNEAPPAPAPAPQQAPAPQ
jgi:peptidyl-prolyl cis-trans isomerase SurA